MPRSTSLTRRTALTGVLSLTAVLALAACGSGSSGDGGNEITFWDDNGGPTRTPIYTKLIADFEKANPTISVKYVGLPSDSVQQKYDTAIAGGSVPDVGAAQTTVLAGLIAQRALVPLDDRLAASALKNKIVPGFLKTARGAAGDGKLYGLPYTGNAEVLWYRKDLFDAKGLAAPQTYDEFFAAATALTGADKKTFGYTIRGGTGSIVPLLAQMYAYSGVNTFFDAANRSTVNDPKHVEFLTKYAALYNTATPKADLNNGFKEMVAQFDGGDIAMLQHNLGSTADHQKALGDKAVAAPLPASAAGTGRTLVGDPVGTIAVFAGSKKQDAAWKFAEFMASQQANSYWNERVGQLPANLDVREEPWIAKSAPVQTMLTALTATDTQDVAAPIYLPQWSGLVKTDMEPLWQKVLLKQLTAQEFLDTFADRLTKAQTQWEARQK